MGEQGKRLYEAASALQMEGIVAKRADSAYKAGRSPDWVKIRTAHGRHVQEKRDAVRPSTTDLPGVTVMLVLPAK